ncbi:FkbM family methyltransferase [Runella sp.]|uniref:FkbM family methyltransferase n=1 Tax=Runella sp. TaxID=1960881 RepID=UPI00301A65AC
MKNDNLIYDIGLHLGYDTSFYLSKGFKVIAIEANPELINKAKSTFKNEISSGKLTLLNIAISEKDFELVPFYVSKERSIQSSLQKSMAQRNSEILEVKVESAKLATIFEKYGVPLYCKIDIEGYDYIALESLNSTSTLPQFISAEISNVSNDNKVGEDIEDINLLNQIWLSILIKLSQLGYKKFKIVDQASLRIMGTNSYNDFGLYDNNLSSRLYKKIYRFSKCIKNQLAFNLGYLTDSSGPFGNELSGEWLDFEETSKIITEHGKNLNKNGIKVMWCDIHATF